MKPLLSLTNHELLNGINEKDKTIFSIVYNHYFPSLYQVAQRYVKDTYVAEEIVQDVFFKLWEDTLSLNNAAAFRAYLYRSVVNCSINYLNRQKLINRHHELIAEQTKEDYIDTLVEEEELKILIYNAIERLPEQCKKVFKLSRHDGLKYREIAVQLGLSEKTVENHMANALKLLRKQLINNETVNINAPAQYKLQVWFMFIVMAHEYMSV